MLLLLRRSFSSTRVCSQVAVKNVAVIGAGLMGSGIAQVTAQSKSNYQVVLIDQNQKILDNALKSIEKNIVRVAKKKFEADTSQQEQFLKKVLSAIKVSTDLEASVSKANLVVEAVVENIDLKQKLLSQVEGFTSSDTIIATNTSSLRLADISKFSKRKENFGGLHFFNPVPVMKLLEVVRGELTSDQTFKALIDYGRGIEKTTVSCKDTPGFIVNRLLVPYLFEAIRMYERGDASKEDIDLAMKLGAGYPMGPFELADYVGLDTTKFIQEGWHKSYPNEPLFKSVNILKKLVDEGKLGKKTGEGFYKYQK